MSGRVSLGSDAQLVWAATTLVINPADPETACLHCNCVAFATKMRLDSLTDLNQRRFVGGFLLNERKLIRSQKNVCV